MKLAHDSTKRRGGAMVTDRDALLWDQSLRMRMATYGLSRREQEIALLAIRGLSNREIADRLFICEQTVKDHLYSTFTKLGINRRTQLSARLLGVPLDYSRAQFPTFVG